MATTLATAWLNIVPSMKGVSAAVNAGFGKVNGTSIGNRIGSQLKLGVASGSAGTGSKVEGEIGAVDGSAAGAAVGGRFGAMFTKVAAAEFGAISGIVQSVFSKAGDVISSNITGAISRADQMNNFPKVMQNLGFSADDAAASIKKISGALDGLPTSTAAMTGMVQKIAPMCDSLDDATNISLAFNDALLAGGKSTQDQENALEQYSQMLAAGKVDSQAWLSVQNAMPGQLDQLAKALLGPEAKANDLKDAMQDGKVSFDDFNKALVDLDKNGKNGFASFEKQARDSTNGIGTAMSNMSSRVQKAIQKVIEAVGVDNIGSAINDFSSQFGKVGDAAASAVKTVKDWFGKLGTDLQQLNVFGGLQDAWNDAVGRIQSIDWTTIIPSGTIDSLTENVAGVLKDISSPVSDVINWVGQGVQAVGQFVGAFANTGALKSFGDLVQSVSGFIESVWNACKNALEKLGELTGFDASSWGETAGNAFKKVADWAKGIVDNVTKISDWCSQHSGAVATALVTIGTGLAVFKIGSAISTVASGLQDFSVAAQAAAVAQGVLDAVMALNPFVLIAAAIAAVVAGLVYFFTQTETGRQMWANFCSAMSSAWSAVCSFFSSALNNVKTWFSNTGNAISNVWNSVISFVSGVPGRIVNLFSSLPGRVIGFFQSIPSRVTSIDWGGVGRNVVHGIANGISKFGSVIVTNILGAAKNALNAVKNFFGIHSPSRVMRDQVGKYVALGMAEGIDGYASSGVDAMRDAAGSIVGAGQDVLSGFDPSVQLQSDLSKAGRANMTSAIDSQLTIPSKSDPNAMTYEQMVEALKTALDAQDTTIVLDTGVVAGSVNRRLGTNMNRGL